MSAWLLKYMGVLTHLDEFKDEKELNETIKRLQDHFWTEIYQGTIVSYVSGLEHELYYTDPSATFWQCDAKAIGSGFEGADSSLQEQFNKDMTLQEAKTAALSILKQVMEEKDRDRFWRMPECYIRGNTIKYLRVPDEAIDKVQEETNKSRSDRKPPGVRRGRGRGREDGPGGRPTKGIGRGDKCMMLGNFKQSVIQMQVQ